jgi:restriction system protein
MNGGSESNRYEPVTLTPKQFEEEVEKLLNKLGSGRLAEFRTQRLETIQTADGDYEIDITARFEVLQVNFLVLVECKHHKNPIKRSVVQILRDNLRASGAHKGTCFSD